MLLIGPPGAGKGTQAKLLQGHFHVPHVSSGDLLRASVLKHNTVGIEAESYMQRGELVPDSVLIRVVEERLAEADCAKGFILDGFPRTIAQAEVLEGLLTRLHTKLDNVTSIKVPGSELVRRISGRRQCPECGSVYHVELDPPKKQEVCDTCGGSLRQRNDDREATVVARLGVYERETAPLLDYYRKRGILREVNGVGGRDQIAKEILALAGADA